MSDCLLLNSDGLPTSIFPLSTITWQDAISYLVNDKITVLEWHDDWVIRSEKWSTPVPSVAILKTYHKKKHGVKYSKTNVFLRDDYRCGYCGTSLSSKNATLDHIIPQSHGGTSTWQNTCCACESCNMLKSNKKNIRPKCEPYKPSFHDLAEKYKKHHKLRHDSWGQWIS